METTGPPSRSPHLLARPLSVCWRAFAPGCWGITSLLRNLGGGEELRVVGGERAGDEFSEKVLRELLVRSGQSFL